MQSFRPITLERPKTLIPLVNTPLIDYTLEWLAMNNVEEVGCKLNHAQQTDLGFRVQEATDSCMTDECYWGFLHTMNLTSLPPNLHTCNLWPCKVKS